MSTKLFLLTPDSLSWIAAIFGMCTAIVCWLAWNYQEKRMKARSYTIFAIGKSAIAVASGMNGVIALLLALLYLLIADGVGHFQPNPQLTLAIAVGLGALASGLIPAVWLAPQLFGFDAEWEQLLDHDERVGARTIEKIKEGKISLTP